MNCGHSESFYVCLSPLQSSLGPPRRPPPQDQPRADVAVGYASERFGPQRDVQVGLGWRGHGLCHRLALVGGEVGGNYRTLEAFDIEIDLQRSLRRWRPIRRPLGRSRRSARSCSAGHVRV